MVENADHTGFNLVVVRLLSEGEFGQQIPEFLVFHRMKSWM
jgi:hypothetical protein